MTHDLIKEFSCSLCGYNTSRKRTLDKHMKQLHWELASLPNVNEEVLAANDRGQAMKLEQDGPNEMKINWLEVVQPLTS